MRLLISFFLIIHTVLSLFAQDEKRDNVWLMGYGSNNIDTTFGGTRLDFNSEPANIFYEYRELNFYLTDASICNQNGELLFLYQWHLNY